MLIFLTVIESRNKIVSFEIGYATGNWCYIIHSTIVNYSDSFINGYLFIILGTDDYFTFSFACTKLSRKLIPLSNKLYLGFLEIARYFVNLSILLIFDSLSFKIETKDELINDCSSSALRSLFFNLLQHYLIYEFAASHSLKHLVSFHYLSSNNHNQQLN